MTDLTVEHRGYKIRYSDNDDNWWCPELGSGKAASSESLRKIKERIDKVLLNERKASALSCFVFKDYQSPNVVEADLIEYLGPNFDGGGYSHKPRHVSDQKIAITSLRGGKDRISRRETTLSSLIPDTPEAHAALAEAKRLFLIADEAKKVADAALKAVPRVTIDMIERLVKISGLDPTGGLPK